MKDIVLKNGMKILLDDEDFEKFSGFNFHAFVHGNTSYARRGIYDVDFYKKYKKSKTHKVFLHREILNIKDPKICIDHIDGNGLNNQKSNLRICTHSQNMWNRVKDKKGTSKFKGVSFRKNKRLNGVFVAAMGFKNKRWHIGHYDSEIEAALAYNVCASFAFREFAHLNKIEV